MKSPGAPIALDGLTKHEIHLLHQFDQIRNPAKAELFLRHHAKLEFALAKLSYGTFAVPPVPAGLSVGTSPRLAPTVGDPSGTGGGPQGAGPGSQGGPIATTGPVQANGPSTTSLRAISPIGGTTTTTPVATDLDATLNQIYADRSDSTATLESLFAGRIIFRGNDVEVTIRGNGDDVGALEAEVQGIDPNIQVTDHSATYMTVDAYVPVADLAELADGQLVGSVAADPPSILN